MPESADPGTDWVDVYSKTTGQKQTVPSHYLDNPVLSRDLRKTPLSEQQQREADATAVKASPTNTPPAGDKE